MKAFIELDMKQARKSNGRELFLPMLGRRVRAQWKSITCPNDYGMAEGILTEITKNSLILNPKCEILFEQCLTIETIDEIQEVQSPSPTN